MRKINKSQITIIAEGKWMQKHILFKDIYFDIDDNLKLCLSLEKSQTVCIKDTNLHFKNLDAIIMLEIIGGDFGYKIYSQSVAIASLIFNLFLKAEEIKYITMMYILSQQIQYYKFPIFIVHNTELMKMIDNSDINTNLSIHSLKLPYNQFILKTYYNNTIVEVLINIASINNKIQLLINGLYDKGIGTNSTALALKIGDEAWGYYVHTEYDQLVEDIKEFILKILYFFSIEKNIIYINKTVNNKIKKPKTLSERKNNTNIINLFDEFKYIYDHKNKTDTNNSAKIPHMVRGHFRNQPYGERNNREYKVIWIKPYYTGNDLSQIQNKVYKVIK